MNEIVKRTETKKEKKRERGTFTLIHLLHTHGDEKKNAEKIIFFLSFYFDTQTHIRILSSFAFFLSDCEHKRKKKIHILC